MNALRRIAAQVQEVQVIEPPQRIEVGKGCSLALLPIHPPEIDALGFQGMMQDFEVGLRESGIGDVERRTASPVAGSLPSLRSMAGYAASCGQTPSAGCRLRAVFKPSECRSASSARGSGKRSRFQV
jgi:hypothetical protein